MLVLYETALGFCLFKLTDTAKLESADLWEEFESPEKANKLYVPHEHCHRTHAGSESNSVVVSAVVIWNVKVEASRPAPVHVHRDGSRRNHRDSGRQNGQGPQKILVKRDCGERKGR